MSPIPKWARELMRELIEPIGDAHLPWARELIARAGDVVLPSYGSTAWQKAPPAVQVASCVRAAEAWRRERDAHTIAAQLDAELEAEWRYAERDYAGWHRVAHFIAETAYEPSHAELVRRRSEAA